MIFIRFFVFKPSHRHTISKVTKVQGFEYIIQWNKKRHKKHKNYQWRLLNVYSNHEICLKLPLFSNWGVSSETISVEKLNS